MGFFKKESKNQAEEVSGVGKAMKTFGNLALVASICMLIFSIVTGWGDWVVVGKSGCIALLCLLMLIANKLGGTGCEEWSKEERAIVPHIQLGVSVAPFILILGGHSLSIVNYIGILVGVIMLFVGLGLIPKVYKLIKKKQEEAKDFQVTGFFTKEKELEVVTQMKKVTRVSLALLLVQALVNLLNIYSGSYVLFNCCLLVFPLVLPVIMGAKYQIRDYYMLSDERRKECDTVKITILLSIIAFSLGLSALYYGKVIAYIVLGIILIYVSVLALQQRKRVKGCKVK